MRRWPLNKLRSTDEDPAQLAQVNYPQAVWVEALPQLFLESQRIDLPMCLFVALPDQVRVEVRIVVHVLFLSYGWYQGRGVIRTNWLTGFGFLLMRIKRTTASSRRKHQI